LNYASLKTIYAISEQHPVILFDGICNLCNGFVRFVIRYDKQEKFRFLPLQEFSSDDVPPELKIKAQELNTVLLLNKGKLTEKSTAALNIIRQLAFPFNLGYVFILFPLFIRNAVYDFIARNRYHWFGKQDTCMIPTPELMDRFIKQ
jgi:predicted DCC family thiol-disulfide oxidoreductase YuxK